MRTGKNLKADLEAAVVLLGLIILCVRLNVIPSDMVSQELHEETAPGEEAGLSEEKAGHMPLEKEKPVPEKYLIKNFRIIYQEPELPTGCEVTALAMVLNYYGLYADKVVLASEYLPTASAEFYYGEDGLMYGTDLDWYFLGDPASESGYICGTKAIRLAAARYLLDKGSAFRAVDKTGASPKELYRMVSEDTPVVVWVTINMEERQVVEGWHTKSGGYVDWASNDHGAVLIGYTEDTVTIADPLAGKVEYKKEVFEKVFASRGRQCVILE